MTRDHAHAGSTVDTPRAQRFSLSTYTGRLSGTTRTFRDPIEVDGISRRGLSPSGSSRMPLGATRTFRDPSIRGLTGPTKTRPDSVGTGGKSAAATERRESSPPTSNGRRASLQEWLTTRAIASAQKTERRGGGRNQEDAESPSHHKERPGLDSPGDGASGDYEAHLEHAPFPEETELTVECGVSVGGESNDNQHERQRTILPTPSSLIRGRSSDNITGSDDQPISKDKLATQGDDDGGIENIYDSPVGDGVPRQVTFLSGTMGLTVDISDPMQPQPPDELWQHQQKTHDDQAPFPASPCSGVILETSPRYGSLQIFRKEMSRRGINAQMFHTGWKGSFLPPRDIRLFLSDSRRTSVLYWRYRKNARGRGGGEVLGAEDRQVIPLSSLANIGPAELYQQPTSKGARGRLSSWLQLPLSRKPGGGGGVVNKAAENKGNDSSEKCGQQAGLPEVPVLALSYWVDGEPRWVGDQPKRFLVKPDSLDAFRSLTQGLRLCCLHFHNHSCPQDLEDIR